MTPAPLQRPESRVADCESQKTTCVLHINRIHRMWNNLQLLMERSCSIPISWWPFENPGPKFVWCCFEKSRLHLHEGISMDYRLHQISMPPNATDHAAFQAFRQQYYSFIGIWRRYLSLKVLTRIYFVEVISPR